MVGTDARRRAVPRQLIVLSIIALVLVAVDAFMLIRGMRWWTSWSQGLTMSDLARVDACIVLGASLYTMCLLAARAILSGSAVFEAFATVFTGILGFFAIEGLRTMLIIGLATGAQIQSGKLPTDAIKHALSHAIVINDTVVKRALELIPTWMSLAPVVAAIIASATIAAAFMFRCVRRRWR